MGQLEKYSKYHIGALIVWQISQMVIERWLGKTEKTQAGSQLEWLELTAAFLIVSAVVFFKGMKNDKSGTPKGSN